MATDMLKQHRTGFMHKGLFSSPDSGKVRGLWGGNLSHPRSDFSKPPINEQHQVRVKHQSLQGERSVTHQIRELKDQTFL